jgi:S-formylglutathione hydrolase FrmB
MSDLIDGVLTSSLIHKEVRYRIIVPGNYGGKKGRYPVLYLLHGLFGSFENWSELTRLREYASGYSLMIVMPEGGDNWYTDQGSGEDHESYLIRELMPAVEEGFRTIATRGGRAIAGNSMGGYGAFKIALKYPKMFGFAASFSGAFDAPTLSGSSGAGNWSELGPSLTKVFGGDRPWIRTENDLKYLASKASRPLPSFYFDCGLEDEFIMANRGLARAFTELGVEHEYHEFAGGHDWTYWDLRIESLLRLASERLDQPISE